MKSENTHNCQPIAPLYGEQRPILKAIFMRTESELGRWGGRENNMKENAPNKIFIIASFLIVLAVSVIDACTAPVFYALKDISLWGPVGVVSTVVTLLVIWWFKHLSHIRHPFSINLIYF
jgi:hypothetical protein